MRRSVAAILLASSLATVASADEQTGIRVQRLREPIAEPLLHLDATALLGEDADGGIIDGRAALLDLGPRARLVAQGKWWQSGLSPSMFASDLQINGWRVSAELSYDLGAFRVGVNASMARTGELTHRMVGLFAYRTFRLSRWMRAWIVFGVAYEQWDGAAPHGPRQGVTMGLTVGTTFR